MSTVDRVAVVTGAGSGIGRATAKIFYQAGYRVVLVGRNLASLQNTQQLAQANDDACLIKICDVADQQQVTDLFASVMDQLGRVDVLINSAGYSAPKVEFENLDLKSWQHSLDTNLTGVFLCSQQCFRIMKNQQPRGGKIINLGSLAAHSPRPNSAAYTATKHALTGLTKSLALDGRDHGIVCTQIDLGTTDTPLTYKFTDDKMDPETVAKTILHIANLPENAGILNLTMFPPSQPFVGRG